MLFRGLSTLRGGAVKVQYPGIGMTIQNDLQLLKQFVLPFFQTEYIANAVQEIERRLFEEIDYSIERRTTQLFYERGQMDGVVVPRVLAVRRAMIHGDVDQLIACHCALGVAHGDRKLVEEFYHAALAPLDTWARLPYQVERFDFGKHTDYCARGAALYRNIIKHNAMNGYTAEPVLFYRTIHGLYRLFTRLKARVRMHNAWSV